MFDNDSFGDSFLGMLTGEYSKLAKGSLEKESREKKHLFGFLGLLNKLEELKLISEEDIKGIFKTGEIAYWIGMKSNINEKLESLSKMDKEYNEAYLKEIDIRLDELRGK